MTFSEMVKRRGVMLANYPLESTYPWHVDPVKLNASLQQTSTEKRPWLYHYNYRDSLYGLDHLAVAFKTNLEIP
jgi:hypothetical protein